MKRTLLTALLTLASLPLLAQSVIEPKAYIYNEPIFDFSYGIDDYMEYLDTLENSCYRDFSRVTPLDDSLMFIDDEAIRFRDSLIGRGAHRITFTSESLEFYGGVPRLQVPVCCDLGNHLLFETYQDAPVDTTYYLGHIIHSLYLKADTIFSRVRLSESGGSPPDTHLFRFNSNEVDHIDVKTRVIYAVTLAYDINGRDDWAPIVTYLATEWFIPNRPDLYSYRLPILGAIEIDDATFKTIREKSVAVHQKILIDRDHPYTAYPEAFEEVRSDVLSRLSPNYRRAKLSEELLLLYGARHFESFVTVHLLDGTKRQYTHIADKIISTP